MNNILLLGPPGCGKGTQANLLSKRDDYVLLATGDLLRNEIKRETLFGEKIKQYIDNGLLVPDNLITDFILQYIKDNEILNKKLLFDGFPRTIEQAEVLDEFLKNNNTLLKKVLLFKLDNNTINERILNRRICEKCAKVFPINYEKDICDNCGGTLIKRSDDSKETVLKRIEVYEKQTKPLIDFYASKNILIEVNVEGSIEEVYDRIKEVING